MCLYICCVCVFFFFKQKTAYEMRISDWSSDVCSSDLRVAVGRQHFELLFAIDIGDFDNGNIESTAAQIVDRYLAVALVGLVHAKGQRRRRGRSEERRVGKECVGSVSSGWWRILKKKKRKI